MTNKPMLSVERELLEDFADYADKGKVAEPYMAQKLRALLDAQHAVCSNGILCQNSKCAECGGNGAYKPSKVTGEDVLRWMDEHAAAQHQGEPVAYMVQTGTHVEVLFEGNDWLYKYRKAGMRVTPLYAEQPAPVPLANGVSVIDQLFAPPGAKFDGELLCKGSLALGNGCGKCARCADEAIARQS